MLEFIFELLFDLIFEGALELGTYKKVPMPIRIIALLAFLAVYGFLVVVIFMLARDFIYEGKTLAGVVFFALDIFFFFGGIHMIRKKFEENNIE